MRRSACLLLTVLAMGIGASAIEAAGPASAATAAPWVFVQVVVSGSPDSSGFVPLTAFCPSGFTPISGGMSGPLPFEVINEYATYSNDSFSEQIDATGSGVYQLTAECARADQVGTIQVVSTDFGRNSSDLAGGWVACPAGTRAIGGGADWNLAGSRDVLNDAPSDDDASWYATGSSSTSGNTLHVEAYCANASELAAAQRATQPYTDPAFGTSLQTACPTGTRVLTGGVYTATAGNGADPGQFSGIVQVSYPDDARLAWHASVPLNMPAGATVFVTAWCVPASIPTVTITAGPPAQTNQTSAQFSFTASDPAGYPLTYTCILDRTPTSCGPPGVSYGPLSEGTHLFSVEVKNGDSEVGSASWLWIVDTTAPAVAATAPAQPFTLASTATVSWTGQDNAGGTGIASYQVRERKAAYNYGLLPWTHPARWRALTATSVTVSGLAQGWDYCFAVRAVDRAGNMSAWTTPICTARPLDDRALKVSAGWVRGTGSKYWNGTITSANSHSATATRKGAELDRVGIVATLGPGMGTVAVYVGATRIGTISLAAAVTHYRRLLLLPPFTYRTGAVSVKVISFGKPVQVDGLAASRS
jgi:hypothetical protein